MKKAYLFIADFGDYGSHRLSADLFFSSEEKFKEMWPAEITDFDQLVEVNVPDDFNDWDYIPDNY